MPKTNTACPTLREYFCEVGRHWIREYDVDGWRLDVANEVDDGFLRAFRQAVKQEKKDAVIIGEIWENAEHYMTGDMVDSAMNYDFRRFCTQYFAENLLTAPEFDLRLSSLLMRYKKQMLPAQLNLLDGHDTCRFLTLCKGDLDKMELAVLFQMTFIGMPCVFYGDEKGMRGLTEPEYRMPMPWDTASPLTDIYKRLIALRKKHPALTRGSFETVDGNGICCCIMHGPGRTNASKSPSILAMCRFLLSIRRCSIEKRLYLWFTDAIRLCCHKERSSWRTRSMIWQRRQAYPLPRYPGH